MANWETLSETRRTWMVYRTVRGFEPTPAGLTMIRDAMEAKFAVTLHNDWLLRRLKRFKRRHYLACMRVVEDDGVNRVRWYITDVPE
jgi:hypothetical protein